MQFGYKRLQTDNFKFPNDEIYGSKMALSQGENCIRLLSVVSVYILG